MSREGKEGKKELHYEAQIFGFTVTGLAQS